MVSVLEKEYKRAYSAYEKAQQALEETEKRRSTRPFKAAMKQ